MKFPSVLHKRTNCFKRNIVIPPLICFCLEDSQNPIKHQNKITAIQWHGMHPENVVWTMQGKRINRVEATWIHNCLEIYQVGSALIFLKGFLISSEILFTPISEINTGALDSSSNHPMALRSLLIALRLLSAISLLPV